MKFGIVSFLSLLQFSFNAFAEIPVEAFGKKLVIPANCTFTVKDEGESSFYCPSRINFKHAISFEDPIDFLENMEKFEEEQEALLRKIEEEAQDVKLTTFESATINDQYHYLRIFQSDGDEIHVYNICDFTFCVEIFSKDSNFVRQLVEQINASSIYNYQNKKSLLYGG
ncbi:hypothetical protein [Thalassomonas sp. M1454]|uniref:hypothetical protein n=1 Tax=Thalassomonas sp. M1454 TaxID=2594477 RepID=UPI00117D9FA0|nr:hypothetical protein [Thalassomonas sp. M1454]TRX56995.1 hypothetical protein FNN08_05660 [Thalassomonas sp. M1454]